MFTVTPRFTLLLLTLVLFPHLGITQDNQGLSLDQLMGSKPVRSSPEPGSAPNSQQDISNHSSEPGYSRGVSLDNLMGTGRQSRSAMDASLDFGTIREGQRLVAVRDANDQLMQLDQQISQRCTCASNSCYDLQDSSDISQSSVIDAAREVTATLNNQVRNICGNWPGVSASEDIQIISQQAEIAGRVLDAMEQLDDAAIDAQEELEQQDADIRYELARRQEEQQQQSGFNWGQFAALTVGAVAGGAANLDVDTQSQILSSIVSDSMNGGGSTSNFQATMNSLNADMASMSSFGGAGGIGGVNADLARMSSPGPSSGGLGGMIQGIGGNSGSSSGLDSGGNLGSSSSSPNPDGNDEFVVDEIFTFTCPIPGAQPNSVPIKAKSQACGDAMKHFGEVYGCNLVDSFESARRQYESACASEMYQ